MGFRTEKRKAQKFIKKLRIIFTAIAIIICFASCVVWFFRYSSPKYLKFITLTQTIFIVDIILYIGTVSSNTKLYVSITRSFLKLLFSVWIVSFVLLSITSQYKQNMILIYATFFIGYLEVLFDLDDVLKGEIASSIEGAASKVKLENILFKFSKQITILLVSLMNMAIAFLLQSSLSSFDKMF